MPESDGVGKKSLHTLSEIPISSPMNPKSFLWQKIGKAVEACFKSKSSLMLLIPNIEPMKVT